MFPPCPPHSNIACNCEETQRQIAAAGALPVLRDMLDPQGAAEGGGGGAWGDATGGVACREAAAWTLSNLLCSAHVREELRCGEGWRMGGRVPAAV